ncbi:MAG: DJ-1/PfpI family protein [Balneolaceae bacterium]
MKIIYHYILNTMADWETGLTIQPDFEISEVNSGEAALMILPGAEEWPNSEHEQVLELARTFLEAEIPVAGICGATEAMARQGMLDDVSHTSNGLEILKMTCPEYKGASLYQDKLAVTDGNLITAGSSSAAAFAYHILKKLDVMKPDILDHWYGYFEKHSTDEVMKLVEKLT